MSIEAAASVPPALNRTRALVEPAMREAVARLDPANRSITEYHLGWTEADGTPREGTAGKAVRPTVVMLAAQLFGGAGGGVARSCLVELVHNFSLIHDDVMDGDTERRHRPTVWALWGVPAAILTGDALLNLAQEVLLPSDSRASAALGRAVRELIRGRPKTWPSSGAAGSSWTSAGPWRRARRARCCRPVRGSAACWVGRREMVDALGAYGAHVGMAFQLVDDVLGIWGDAAVTGKPVLSDLRTRKKSLPVTYVLSAGGAPARAVVDWLGSSEPEGGPAEAELERVAGVLADAGGRDWASPRPSARWRRRTRPWSRCRWSSRSATS